MTRRGRFWRRKKYQGRAHGRNELPWARREVDTGGDIMVLLTAPSTQRQLGRPSRQQLVLVKVTSSPPQRQLNYNSSRFPTCLDIEGSSRASIVQNKKHTNKKHTHKHTKRAIIPQSYPAAHSTSSSTQTSREYYMVLTCDINTTEHIVFTLPPACILPQKPSKHQNKQKKRKRTHSNRQLL